MRNILEQKYESLFERYHLEKPIDAENVNALIKSSLQEFLSAGGKTAIYCNGEHTRMLMADFMFELKGVRHIVDNYAQDRTCNSGFRLIKDEDLEREGIEAVIVSTYKFKDSIIRGLEEKHPAVRYLDLYEKMAEGGICLRADYYYNNHPYHHYRTINTLKRQIGQTADRGELERGYVSLLTEYLQIKDFRLAIDCAGRLANIGEKHNYGSLISDLRELYGLEQEAFSRIDGKNVLLFCMDGLRRQDLTPEYMPNLAGLCRKEGYVYGNAYSYSTSTYESLVPVYSENSDMRTEYFRTNSIGEEQCRFVQEARRQGRRVYFYTDMDHFIEGEDIRYSGAFQTVTQKLWSFLLDAVEEENGLFYIHELYESHYSFSNPYTEDKLISEGTAMLFDYLPQKGGELRSDYVRQHEDALGYLDDVTAPLLERMKCRMLLYADHGNLVLEKGRALSRVGEMEYSCSEGWTRIPLALFSPETGAGRDHRLISLMELNNMVISLLRGEPYTAPDAGHIKMARSEIYNPDFKFLYRAAGHEKSLQAFECFLFAEGKKLMVYADGSTQIYDLEDRRLEAAEKGEMIREVRGEVTVCESIREE